MEFHQLKGLVALAESRSFTRAAQMTHVVQSTLSQQIRSLEEELGVQLVVRTTRKVELTADSGNMTDTNVNVFIDHSSISSNIWVNIPGNVTIGLVLDNQSRAFTGYLYAPPLSEAGSALRSYAAGRTQMGAVLIEYGGETYVVAMFA